MAHDGWVGVLSVEVQLPCAASLKDKRSEVRRIKAGLARRWGVSIAEVGYQDKWQRAALALAVISPDVSGAESTLAATRDWLSGDPEIELLSATSWVAPASGEDGLAAIEGAVG